MDIIATFWNREFLSSRCHVERWQVGFKIGMRTKIFIRRGVLLGEIFNG